jgi:hypothetical protein
MATINITVQSLLNTAVYDTQTVDTAGTIGDLKTAMETNFSYSATWFDLVFNEQVLDTAQTIGSYGIVEGSQLRTHNKIARLSTRELRQEAKLALAALDRAASSNTRSEYDITELPTYYVNDTVTDNPNSTGLIEGRPWVSGSLSFDGSNYLSVAGGLGTAMGTGNFTWEAWVYPTSSSGYQAFMDTRTDPLGGGDTTGFYFGTNDNTLTPIYYTNGLQLASTIDLTLNAWNHVALVRTSGTVKLWVNGALGGTKVDSTNLTEQRVFIGSGGMGLYLTGNISNLRIVKGIALYTSAFTVPTQALTAIAGTQLLVNVTNNIASLKDISTNNFAIANTGGVATSTANPF